MTVLGVVAQACAHAEVDLSGTASDYSKLAGLLAGFAFSSFFIVVVRRLDLKTIGAIAHVAELLLATFVCLVLTSLNYAVLAGEPLIDDRSTGRATSAAVIAGVGFIMSGVLLLYALIVALDAADESSRTDGEAASQAGGTGTGDALTDPDKGLLTALARRLRAATSFFLAPLFMMLAIGSLTDYRAANSTPDDWLLWFGWGLFGAHVIVSGIVAARWRTRSADALSPAHFSSSYVGFAVLVVTACTFAFQLVFLIDPCDSVPPVGVAATLVAAFVALVATTLVAAGFSLPIGQGSEAATEQ